MSVLISPESYKKILQGDLNWLLKQPECLEKDHIEAILKNLIKRIEEGKEFQLWRGVFVIFVITRINVNTIEKWLFVLI